MSPSIMGSRLMNAFHKVKGGHDSSIRLPFTSRKESPPPGGTSTSKLQREEEKRLRQALAHEEQKKVVIERKEQEARLAESEAPENRARYDNLDAAHISRPGFEFFNLAELDESKVDQEVSFRARLHQKRNVSTELAFFILRQRLVTVQAVLETNEDVTKNMVKFGEHLTPETILLVKGTVKRAQQTVKSCTIHDLEILVSELHVVSAAVENLPFKPSDYELSKTVKDVEIQNRTLWNNPILHLRSPSAIAIMRINAGICNMFRSHLDSQGFLEIHSPKLQGGATESGSSVFKVNYFTRDAFLAQSPQFTKEACISADFGRVYEVGPVFRAENSQTHRHLTEYTGLDLEMEIRENYHEALWLIDDMLKTVFKGMYERFDKEFKAIEEHFDHQRLVWLDKTPRLTFKEGVQLLVDSGWKVDGHVPSAHEDLDTRSEIRLGQLVKEKYKTDYYILDKFPVSARPFYTMRDADGEYTNSFDLFVRGQEILTGGQRVHNLDLMVSQIEEVGLRAEDMEEYLAALKFASYPHAGCGIGLERIVMLLLNLPDIRFASLVPRDPRSFPIKAKGFQLRYPEASTLTHVKGQMPQDIEKMIASYGDAVHTGYSDKRIVVWRHESTGAAVGYCPSDGFAITLGDPLCDSSQYELVVTDYLHYLKKEAKLHPLWLLISEPVEHILASKQKWNTVSCVAEQRIKTGSFSKAVNRKVGQAEREGVTITALPRKAEISNELKERIDKRIADWLASRKGTQIHLTSVRPWDSSEYRRYLYAEDKEGTICALVVLSELSVEHGYQLKWALDFPGAPSGTIEAIVMEALSVAQNSGASSVTFGTSAMPHLEGGEHINGIAIKSLAAVYRRIVKNLKLTQKTEFRSKLGADADKAFIAWPSWGFGPRAMKAIFDFLEADEGQINNPGPQSETSTPRASFSLHRPTW